MGLENHQTRSTGTRWRVPVLPQGTQVPGQGTQEPGTSNLSSTVFLRSGQICSYLSFNSKLLFILIINLTIFWIHIANGFSVLSTWWVVNVFYFFIIFNFYGKMARNTKSRSVFLATWIHFSKHLSFGETYFDISM